MWRDAEERMAEVTAPPRLEPLEDLDIPEPALEAIYQLGALHNFPRPTKLHSFYGTIGRTPELLTPFLQLGLNLSTEISLPARQRELAILRTGWLCGAPYAWGEHVRAAKAMGFSEEEVARVREGSAAQGWSAQDRALLAAVEELHARATLSDPIWAALAEHFDERQMVELLFLAGHYHLTAFVQNALRIPLSPDNKGLVTD